MGSSDIIHRWPKGGDVRLEPCGEGIDVAGVACWPPTACGNGFSTVSSHSGTGVPVHGLGNLIGFLYRQIAIGAAICGCHTILCLKVRKGKAARPDICPTGATKGTRSIIGHLQVVTILSGQHKFQGIQVAGVIDIDGGSAVAVYLHCVGIRSNGAVGHVSRSCDLSIGYVAGTGLGVGLTVGEKCGVISIGSIVAGNQRFKTIGHHGVTVGSAWPATTADCHPSIQAYRQFCLGGDALNSLGIGVLEAGCVSALHPVH
ncbi:unknown [Clostridium sp. CAG:1013]|nr:unknown [Clostridium sp. CAG:1013]